jgi:hypothetical protein
LRELSGCKSIFSAQVVAARTGAYNELVLAASLLLVTLAQDSAPELFHWLIEGLADAKASEVVVTVTPTTFGLVSGIHIKGVSLEPTRTVEDSGPRSIGPQKTEVANEWGLRAWFTRSGRRFRLIVTLADETTHRIDPWALRRTEQKRPSEPRPLQLIAPPGIAPARGE